MTTTAFTTTTRMMRRRRYHGGYHRIILLRVHVHHHPIVHVGIVIVGIVGMVVRMIVGISTTRRRRMTRIP